MLKKWKESYRKRSIQRVVLLTFSTVMIVSFLILALVFSHYGRNILEDYVKEENEQQIEILAEGVERELRQAVDFFDTVQYKIVKTEFGHPESFAKMMDFIYEENSKRMNSLLLFDENGEDLYYNENSKTFTPDIEQKKEMYQKAGEDVGKTWFVLLPESKDLLIYRIVELEQESGIKPVVLAGTLDHEKIIRGFEAHEAQDGNYFYLMTKDGQLVFHPKSLLMKHGLFEENLGNKAMKTDGTEVVKKDHEQFLINQRTMGYTGWKIIGVSSLNGAFYKNYPVVPIIWCLIILVGIVAVCINHYIVVKITRPISQLGDSVEAFGKTDEETPIEVEGTYEIRQLADSFNLMQRRIHQLRDKEVQKEQEYWRMQMRLLQSQINPHFLYNTLDSIIWMIQSRRYDGASKMVSALAGFFRISLNKGGDFITVEKEMTHVEKYMEIQGIRFEDKFTFEIHFDENLKNCMCPKLIIQPLAENAVYHGMEGMYGDGEIEINAYEKEGLIYIDVTDNGEGMTEEQIDHLMYGNVVSSKRGSGIGVRNVNERLKYCFGEEYGIQVFSEIDEGTTVRICIPEVEDLDEYWEKKKNYNRGDHTFDPSGGNSSVETGKK